MIYGIMYGTIICNGTFACVYSESKMVKKVQYLIKFTFWENNVYDSMP